MVRRAALLALAALAALFAGVGGQRAGAEPSATVAHSLVSLTGPRTAEAAARAAGGRVVSNRLRIWRVPSLAVAPLRADGAVGYAEPERVRAKVDRVVATDEFLPTQWWFPSVGGDREEPPGPGRPLTVLDSGLDITHPDFAGRPDTELLNEQTIVNRPDFHGTAVASVAAAAVNGVGLVGLYPGARLFAWDGSPRAIYTSTDVITGLERAAARGPGIVNVSLGGRRSTLEALVVADVFARGTIVVAASGNDGERGSPESYPASLPHVVTVGATDRDDSVAGFSSRSRAMDVAAPGVEIPIALPLSLSETGYGRASGTSFSAPMVAAALAWAWTVRPDLEKTQLFELLRRAARDVPPAGRDRGTGFGLLDVPRLLSVPAPTVDPFEPNDDRSQARVTSSGPPRFPLTTPTRGRSRVLARIDVADDPRDVYGAWLPARRRLVVNARTAGELDLGLLGTPPGVATRRRGRETSRTLVVSNPRRTGSWVYVSVFAPVGARPIHTAYTATFTTAAIPR